MIGIPGGLWLIKGKAIVVAFDIRAQLLILGILWFLSWADL